MSKDEMWPELEPPIKKQYIVVANVNNPNIKRFSNTDNLFVGDEKLITKALKELLFKTFINTNGMKVTLTIREKISNV